MLIKNLFGHDYIIDSMFSMLRANNLHHALVFSGNRGIGKFSYAIYLTKFLLSHTIDELVNISEIIVDKKINDLINNNIHSNFLLIKPEYDPIKKSYKDIITVDEVRKVNKFLQTTSQINYYKVIIIDSVDNLNINASNALLKMLEEPRGNVLFILISHKYNNLLETVRSRCINLRFRNLLQKDILSILHHNSISYDNNIFELIKLSEGSYGNLLWYLEEENRKIYSILSTIISSQGSRKEIINFIKEIKQQNNFDYNIINNIIIKLLLLHSNNNNLESIAALVAECNSLSTLLHETHLDKPIVLFNILLKANALLKD